jgi:tetratricopeptide (TPR) repeat protein
MRLRGPLFLLALFVAPVASLVSVAAAWGDDASVASSPTDAGATRHDPDDRTALAEWMERCVQGNKKFLAKDVPGAIDLYKQAVQLAPKRPLPHYLLAEAQLAAGDLPNGEATLKFALDLSDDRDPNVRGKLLFLNADVKEREKKWDEAKAAWQSYADYSSRHADAGMAPTTPPARVQSIDDMIKQDKAYEVVRQRIVEELRDAGPAPVDASKKK